MYVYVYTIYTSILSDRYTKTHSQAPLTVSFSGLGVRLTQTCTLSHPLLLCNLNGSNLLCHDRQHLNVNTVELIEARPGACTGQSLEELAHGHKVKLVGTVEHNTLDSHRLGKILGRGENRREEYILVRENKRLKERIYTITTYLTDIKTLPTSNCVASFPGLPLFWFFGLCSV